MAESDSAIGKVTDALFGEKDADDDTDIIEWITRPSVGNGDENMEKIKQRIGIGILEKVRIDNAFTNAGAFDLFFSNR